jgi:thymidine kinase
MFAGKSTLAVTTVRRWRSLEKNVLVIKHKRDDRYGDPHGMFTHDTPVAPIDCQAVYELMPVLKWPSFAHTDVVVIEEAQFFHDLYAFCVQAVDKFNKNVHVFGLDGNAHRETFGHLTSLCPIAERFVKIPALCQMCKNGTEAAFTIALETIPSLDVLIGGDEVYTAVCRKHYLAHTESAC